MWALRFMVNGYKKVYALKGGWKAWEGANYTHGAENEKVTGLPVPDPRRVAKTLQPVREKWRHDSFVRTLKAQLPCRPCAAVFAHAPLKPPFGGRFPAFCRVFLSGVAREKPRARQHLFIPLD